MKDGWAGTGKVDDAAIAGSDTTLEVDTLANLPSAGTTVPVGVRFTVAGVSAGTEFTVTDSNANEQQTLDLDTPSAGTFTLTFGGSPTANIQWDASAQDIIDALELIAEFDSGDVNVTGASEGPFVIEYTGQYAGADQALMTIDGTGLTNASSAESITELHPGATTWELTFTPALDVADLPVDDDVITFLPQQLAIKIGDGNITYTESNEYEYDLDRDILDTVREGAQVPIDVSIDFVYEFITTGTSEEISVMDALKKKGGASGWVSSSADPCEPYAIDIEVVYTPLCTTSEIETTTFPEFRSESREVDFSEATVSVSGRCNVTEPIITRTAQ